jgi:hypothetical protein
MIVKYLLSAKEPLFGNTNFAPQRVGMKTSLARINIVLYTLARALRNK